LSFSSSKSKGSKCFPTWGSPRPTKKWRKRITLPEYTCRVLVKALWNSLKCFIHNLRLLSNSSAKVNKEMRQVSLTILGWFVGILLCSNACFMTLTEWFLSLLNHIGLERENKIEVVLNFIKSDKSKGSNKFIYPCIP
jgi:hypothetical protein